MKRPTFRPVCLTMAAFLFVSGCAMGPLRRPVPNPAPGNTAPLTQGASMIPPVASDPDACGSALGFSPSAPQGTPSTGAHGVLIGNVALVALPLGEEIAAPPGGVEAGTSQVNPPAPGTPPETLQRNFGNGALNGNGPALARIRATCGVSHIHVVNELADRNQLAQIVTKLRAGTPMTDFIEEITPISRRAVTYTTGAQGDAAGIGETGR